MKKPKRHLDMDDFDLIDRKVETHKFWELTRRGVTKVHDELVDKGIDFKTRTIWINDGVDRDLLRDISAAFQIMERQSKEPIHIKICSEGGNSDEMVAIMALMRNSPCQIITYCFGLVRSATFWIFSHGDLRFAAKGSGLMVHNGSWQPQFQPFGYHIDDVAWAKKAEILTAELLEDVSHIKAEDWYNLYYKRDLWMTPEEAMSVGIVDDIF